MRIVGAITGEYVYISRTVPIHISILCFMSYG